MKDLLKNKSVLYVVGISMGILILVIVLSPKKNSSSSATRNLSVPTSSNTPLELIDLSKDKRQKATIYVESIESKLPLSVDPFDTSVGIKTSINIFRAKDDPSEIVRLEIFGLSYVNKNELDPKKNPNIAAFKESYLKAIEMLESKNIDPNKLIFVYGDKDYVRVTAAYWVDKLKL